MRPLKKIEQDRGVLQMQTQSANRDGTVAGAVVADPLAPDLALAPDLPARIGGRLKLVYGAGATAARIETLDDEGLVSGRLAIAAFKATIPCFTPGTAIATASGPRLAEDLRPGDRVATRDHGLCAIAWIGRQDFDWRMLGLNPLLRPVKILAGALGQGLPMRDLLVSPNHRMLVRRRRDATTDEGEALLPAGELIGRPGIARDDRLRVGYLQILFERHEVILAEGTWSESFQPDRASVAGLAAAARGTLDAAVPGLASDDSPGYGAVRPTVSAEAVAVLHC